MATYESCILTRYDTITVGGINVVEIEFQDIDEPARCYVTQLRNKEALQLANALIQCVLEIGGTK